MVEMKGESRLLMAVPGGIFIKLKIIVNGGVEKATNNAHNAASLRTEFDTRIIKVAYVDLRKALKYPPNGSGTQGLVVVGLGVAPGASPRKMRKKCVNGPLKASLYMYL